VMQALGFVKCVRGTEELGKKWVPAIVTTSGGRELKRGGFKREGGRDRNFSWWWGRGGVGTRKKDHMQKGLVNANTDKFQGQEGCKPRVLRVHEKSRRNETKDQKSAGTFWGRLRSGSWERKTRRAMPGFNVETIGW